MSFLLRTGAAALMVGFALVMGCKGGQISAPTPVGTPASSGASGGSGGSGSGGSTSSSGASGAPCVADPSATCGQGAIGYTCTDGENPSQEDSTLTCITLSTAGDTSDYCCYSVNFGSPPPCVPYDGITCGKGFSGYQCESGDEPTALDPSLVCSTGSPDPDGVHEDFCCTDAPSSSSSGGGSGGNAPPPGCGVDDTIDCTGGAVGYACGAGYNPETEEPELSCSTPVVIASGAVDYCCFAWGAATGCVPDDELTSTCPDSDTYGYQCDAGESPSDLDPPLNCSAGVPDPDGVHVDYCCTYG